MFNDLQALSDYLNAFESDGVLEAAPREPTSWFSLAKAQEAVRTKKDAKLVDVSGNEVILLGTPRVVSGKRLRAGDQFFYVPVTKELLSIKPLAKLAAPASAPVKPAPAPTRPPPTPTKPALVSYSVGSLQSLLVTLGAPAKNLTDGKWGPTSKREWERAARAVGGDPTSQGAPGNRVASVSPATYALLEQRARAVSLGVQPPLFGAAAKPASRLPAKPQKAPSSARTPAASKPTEPSKPGLSKMGVGVLQTVLVSLGTKLKPDNTFGPATKRAWASAAAKRALDPAFDRAGPNEAWVSPATYAALAQASSAPAPAPAPKPTKAKAAPKRPTEPSKSGLTKINVGQAQDALLKLGVKLKRDGMFGPTTKRAWESAAAKRALDPVFDRAGSIEAWVSPATFAVLSGQAGDKQAEPKGVPVSAKKEKPPAPGGVKPPPTRMKLEPLSKPELASFLKGFRVSPKNSVELQRDWAGVAKRAKLDGASSVTKSGGDLVLEVVPETRAKLIPEARLRIDVQTLLGNANVFIPVKQLQRALAFANQIDAYKGKFAEVKPTGSWDRPTENAFFVYFNIPAPAMPMWERALKTLTKAKTTVKLPPNFAASIERDSANYEKHQGSIQKREAVQKKEKVAAKQAEDYLSQRVADATSQLPVSVVQQALSQIREQQKEGIVPKAPFLPPIKITGRWDANTEKGLLHAFGDELWGRKLKPGQWEPFVRRLLRKKAAKGLSGLYGVFGDLAATPTGANYIQLPPLIAQTIQKIAGDFLARSKKGPVRESDDAPVPARKTITDPAYVTGRVPRTKDGEDPLTRAPVRDEPFIQSADDTGPAGRSEMPTQETIRDPEEAEPQPTARKVGPRTFVFDTGFTITGSAPPPEPKKGGGAGIAIAALALGGLFLLGQKKRSGG